MTREEFEKAIHFRTIDAPCCGNCRWMVTFAINNCAHCWKRENRYDNNYRPEVYALNVCDRFERREESE